MKRNASLFVVGGLFCVALTTSAATRYVNLNNPAPVAPYTSWASAATNIQDAVDAAVGGDEIVVTNGVYQSGARAVYGMSNRVAVTKPIIVRSVNGPAVTSIVGYRVPGTTNGPAAVRCAYLTNAALLTGFTLTNGATQSSGDTYKNRSGGGVWCESSSAVISNCVLTGNSARDYGGGANYGTLNNCTLTGNSASVGGGTYAGTLNNCTLTGNSAYYRGGGAYQGTLNNCTLAGNSAYYYDGGGASGGNLNNCIVYYNTAPTDGNCSAGSLNYCCTTPLPAGGTGNTDAEPQLASASHLSASSPCIGRGSAAYARGADLDGEPWANPPAIGCDEYRSGSVTGALSAAINVSYTKVAVGFGVDFEALIGGRVSASRWDFGDGTVVSNRPWASHAWVAPGDYVVELRAYNESYPAGILASVTVHVVQDVHYVALTSVNPVAPYSSWATAATSIQDAVDATVPGGLVLVTDGVYQSGARAVYGMSNRVAVTKPIIVRSVNGPAVTSIVGYQVPGTTNGPAAVRCAYLTNAALLTGFTLTNGATQSSGDTYKNSSGGGVWCESSSAVISNCVLTGNSADYYGYGGGAYQGTLNNCTLTGNSAYHGGGGAYAGTLNNCMLTDNSAEGVRGSGGGAMDCTLNNCTLTGNSADGGQAIGGGAFRCTLNNCTLTDNSAGYYGGGANYCTLNNCTLTGNSAGSGGGAYDCTLNNCTLTGNCGGGTYNGTLNNCIVYYNTAPTDGNCYGGSLNYCCTTPLPAGGTGNTDAEPQLASASHLSANSPCIGRGSAAYAGGTDLDGEPWANPPAIGCDEYRSGSVTGALSAAINVSYTKVAVGFGVDFEALIGGRVSASRWDFGDGMAVSNRPWASHAWVAPGDYVVELRAYNESYPAGILASVTVHVVQDVHYVALTSVNPVAPYSSWATAATSIQDAVDATVPGGLVLVSNGVYQAGATAVYGMSNRVAVTKPIIVRSVNGPAVTSIVGSSWPDPEMRCVYLTNAALLTGFTLTNGATQSSGDTYKNRSGGGVWCESSSAVVSNCVLTGNWAFDSGGGAYAGTLNNCVLEGNSSSGHEYNTLRDYGSGGGAYGCTLNNCTLSGNSAQQQGGGAAYCTLTNCIVTGNSANNLLGGNGGGAYHCTLNGCTLMYNSAFGPYTSNGGGGAYGCTLNNCTLSGNWAKSRGGGAYYGKLNNTTVTGNSADSNGGGAASCTLNNCIVYYNTAPTGGNEAGGSLEYCCTTPLAAGTGNFTNAPLFVDTNGWNNLRLQISSPCINAGNNAYAPGLTDLSSNPRIADGTVDVGAYEYQPTPAPAIAVPPQDWSGPGGATVAFSVSARGTAPLAYQWRKNGTNLMNGGNVSGVTTTNLTLTNVQTNDAGNYTVVVTNAYGSVTSSVAALRVELPAPFVWAKRVASTLDTDNELSIGMSLDSQGNVYVTGWFDGTSDFGGVTLTNKSGGGQDIFLGKYNSAGALQWARRAGGNTANWDVARGVGVDSAGNVYVTGGFYGTADFGTFNLTASQNEDFFLAKYNSAGTVQWVRQNAGGGHSAYGTGLAVDNVGNSYAVGYFDGSSVTFGTTTLVNPGDYNVFLVKYDNTGAVQWAQLMGSPDRTYATKVAVDTAGNVYVHGGFSMNMTIGASNLVSVGGDDMFLAKFDNAGALIWVRQEGGTGDESGEGGVAVDGGGNVYVTSAFGSSPMSFGSTSLTNAGMLDAFIAKFSSSGTVQWARRAGGANLDLYWDAALDGQGNIYAAGALGSDAVAPNGSGGAVVAKYDPAGILQWAYSAYGPPANPAASLAAKCAVDTAGNCYLAGWYQGTATFGTNVLQPQGYWNYFLAKLSPQSASLQFGSLSVSNGVFQVRLNGTPGASVIVYSSLDLTSWTPWQTNTLPVGGLNLVVPMGTNRQFFRARTE